MLVGLDVRLGLYLTHHSPREGPPFRVAGRLISNVTAHRVRLLRNVLCAAGVFGLRVNHAATVRATGVLPMRCDEPYISSPA